MAGKFAENFVSYQLDVENRGLAAIELENVNVGLKGATVASEINDLRTRQKLLAWQVQIEQADGEFRQRRYERALAGYRAVSKSMLELLEPKVSTLKTPKVWVQGTAITKALTGAGAAMLQNLIPGTVERPPVFVSDAPLIDLTRLEAEPAATFAVTPRAPDAVMTLVEKAGVAAEQSQFAVASRLYQQALQAAPAADKQLQAEILLNLGAAEIQQNRTDTALTFLRRAQEAFTGAGDTVGAAEALHNIAFAQLRAGHGADASRSLAEAAKLAGEATLHGALTPPAAPAAPSGTTPPAGTGPVLTPRPPGVVITAPPIRATAAGALPQLAHGALTASAAALPLRASALAIEPAVAVARTVDVDEIASQIGTANFELRVRPIGRQTAATPPRLATPAQQQAESFGRTLSLAQGGQAVSLKWTKDDVLAPSALSELHTKRAQVVGFKGVKDVGFRPSTPPETATLLPHLYALVLPIKMGDCLHQLQQHEQAHQEYLRAAGFDAINTALEAPDLWRRLAENVADWGDSLYRDDLTEQAKPVYSLLMSDQESAPTSVLYTTASLASTGQKAGAWLEALKQGTALPELNPAIAQVLFRVRKRWTYINAGLDFFGALAAAIPPFSFRYLQETARYFAERAVQSESRYIDFYTRFESEQMTRRELENAYEQGQQAVEVAAQNEVAAKATVDAAVAAINLANVRRTDAQNLLNQFNSVSWELEALSGFIARGNAWTGGDLPNLTYTIDGYKYDGKKHEVLQELTQRQTQISNDLQRARMEATIDELAAGQTVAVKQKAVADARYRAAQAETRLAEMRRDQAKEMRDAFNDEQFNPEQWLAMANVMKGLAETALDRAIETARLMQRTYNFENDDDRKVIRSSYRIAATNDLLGGELLLSDIDSFTFYHITRVAQKPIPVKWAVSLSEEYPGQFLQFTRTGRMDFDIDLERLALAHPGTFRHQIKGVEIEVDGFLPPNGLTGRLTCSGLGRSRDAAGAVKLRVQPAETLVLSRFNRRQDTVILQPPQEMRSLFEGNSVASGWTLEVPRSGNDVDLRLVFDVRLVLYFECLFDEQLFESDSTPPQGVALERTRALTLRQHFPDAYFQLRETGRARFELNEAQFPLNQRAPMLGSIALAISPDAGATLDGAGLTVSYPGHAPVDVTVSADNVVAKASLPLGGAASALGAYEIALAPADLARKDAIQDIAVVMDYRYTPA